MKLAALAFAVSLLAFPAFAQTVLPGASISIPPQPPCPPVSGTLSALGAVVSMSCPGAPGYIITATPSSYVGTIVSQDSGTNGGRRLMKTGSIPLDVSTLTFNGSETATSEYRTTGGGDGQKVTAGSYTSGSMAITIRSLPAVDQVFINGEAQSSERVALLNGRAYTANTGLASVAAGNNLQIQLTNPTNSGFRFYITHRLMGCDGSGTLAPKAYTLRNATANPPPTSSTPINRGASTAAPVGTVLSGVTSAAPTGASSAVGIVIPAQGPYDIPVETTVEPGTSITNYIVGPNTGIAGTNATCYITYTWEQLPVN